MSTAHHEIPIAAPPTNSGENGYDTPAKPDTAVLIAIGGVPLSAEVTAYAEKLHHRPLVLMEIAPAQKVSLTSLENFTPDVQLGGPVHEVPGNIRKFTEKTYQSPTWQATENRALWQQRTLEVAEEYVTQHADGQKLAAELGIASLHHLTPEQAVKFSTEFVRSVSKYSSEDLGARSLTRADRTASFDLLREGLRYRGDPGWSGNGVCRNIAANVKAVFDALKSLQTEDTMLANTYCTIDIGVDGDGYGDKRDNPLHTNLRAKDGHAWNVFTTVGENGSAVITIADSTWALGTASTDRTMERAGRFVDELFMMSDDKSQAFDELTHYYHRLARPTGKNTRAGDQTRIQEFALTQYLWAVRQMKETDIDTVTPDVLLGVASRMSGRLDPSEIEALYRCDKASGGVETDRVRNIVKRAFETNHYDGSYLADRFVTPDYEYQKFLFDAIGEQNVLKMADANSAFRIRARELTHLLPPFDIDNPKDARELMSLAERMGVHATNAKEVVRGVNQRITLAAQRAGLEQAVEAITAGRSPYDLVKAAPAILASLHKSTVNT